MNYQMIPYAWVLFLSALVSVGVFISTWHRREVPGTRPILIMMVATTLWCLANALEMMALNLETKLFWANMQYISYNVIPLTWLIMTLQYTGQIEWLTSRRIVLLLIIPILTVLIAFTNEWHELLRQNIFLDNSGPFPVVGKTYGPWFWVHAAYTYPIMLAAAVIHIRAMLPMPSFYRLQTLTLLTGLVLPVLASMAYTFKISPLKFDISPTLLSLCGIVYLWGLRRFKLFDLLPAAYDSAIKSMGDGIIIFDGLDRIVDINPAAERILGNSADLLGQAVSETYTGRVDLAELLQAAAAESEFSVESQEEVRYYEARYWPITDKRRRVGGRVLLLHDVTETERARQELSREQRRTAVLNERERLGRELHDSVGQVLSYVNVQAQAITKLVDAGHLSLVNGYLEKMIAAAREAHADVRRFIEDSLGSGENGPGLFVMLQDLLNNFGENYGFQTQYVDGLEGRKYSCDPVAESEILKIVQEFLNNVREHAKAQKISMEVDSNSTGIRITIRDDGEGFVPDKIDRSKHFGLQIMQDRAQNIGAQMAVISRPGAGTAVTIDLPLHLLSMESTVTN